jgi:hypothetical protein
MTQQRRRWSPDRITEARPTPWPPSPRCSAPYYTVKRQAKQKRMSVAPPPEAGLLAMRLIRTTAADWERWAVSAWRCWRRPRADVGCDLWAESACHPDYDADATLARWAHYTTSPPDRTGVGKLFSLAAAAIKAPAAGYSGNGKQRRRRQAAGDAGEDVDQPPERPVRFSDGALVRVHRRARRGAGVGHLARLQQGRCGARIRLSPCSTPPGRCAPAKATSPSP